jgi:hypothetical protein
MPYALLCNEGKCYQHSLKILDAKITDYKTVTKIEKYEKPVLKMADLMNQKDMSGSEMANQNYSQMRSFF